MAEMRKVRETKERKKKSNQINKEGTGSMNVSVIIKDDYLQSSYILFKFSFRT